MYYIDDEGERVSHLVTWDGDPSKKRGEFWVYPIEAPKPGKEDSHNKEDWMHGMSLAQAIDRGEAVKFRRRDAAEKVAAGDWKEEPYRTYAMEAYKKYKQDKKD
jgi:hypothetical protein